jgi:hypothetical protein
MPKLLFIIKIYAMLKSFKFVPRLTLGFLTLIFLIFIFHGCQKNGEVITTDLVGSDKSKVVKELKDFTNRMKNFKQGNIIKPRDENDMTPAQARDHVEGSFNLDYGYYKIYHGFYTMAMDTFNYTISGGVLSEAQQAEFYDDAHNFISSHFDEVEGEDKLGVTYDVEILSSSSNSVSFEVTSIVGADDDGTTSWSSGDDFEAIEDKKCNNDASLSAYKLLAAAATKDIGGTPSSGAFKISVCKYTWEISDPGLWSFSCWYGPSMPNQCEETLCSSYSNEEKAAEYCIDYTEMNDYLTYIKGDLIPDHVCNSRTFISMTMDIGSTLCLYHEGKWWRGTINYGVGPYTRTEHTSPPYLTP